MRVGALQGGVMAADDFQHIDGTALEPGVAAAGDDAPLAQEACSRRSYSIRRARSARPKKLAAPSIADDVDDRPVHRGGSNNLASG